MNLDRQEQRALVNECRASGMTAKAWCEVKGIEYRQYTRWATKLNKESQHQPQQWVDITIAKEECTMNEIRLHCGKWTIYVEYGFSPLLLADVLKVVDSVC